MIDVLELAPDLEVRFVTIADLREQDINAQEMQPREFERLTENVRERGALESLPYCAQIGGAGPVEVVSGHHRVRAARAAGLTKIPVLVDTRTMTRSQIRAKQIAHNALVGKSNEEVLRQMLAQITSVDDLLATGLPDESLPLPAEDANPVLNTPHAAFEWRTAALTFLPHQFEQFKEVVEALDGSQDFVGVAPVELFDDFARYLAQFARFREIKSVGTTIAVLTRIARDQLEMSKDDASEEEWVKLESVLMVDAMPAPAAKVLREALAKAVSKGKGSMEHPWQCLEAWAAEELAK